MRVADLLVAYGVSLTFGGLRALDGVDLTVGEGTISGLIGPNGAGKTSLLNCICRFYRPQEGQIRFREVDVLQRPAHALAGLGLARTFQHMELFPTMTVLENVLVGAHTRGRPSLLAEALGFSTARRAEARLRRDALATLELVGLQDRAATPVHALPLGMQKRTGLARALACRPRLLLLDEPAGGLNGNEKRELAALLRSLRDRLSLTILLIEHDMDLVMNLCETVTVLDFGRRIATGPPAAIQRDPAVIAAYLGVAGESTTGLGL
jgi:branched-chain amino acid transport system ATP-binding protein